MNIINKVALQGLKKNRTRTIVTVIGVALSSAMFTAVVTFGISLLNYMAEGAAQTYGNWHAAFLDADAAFAQEMMLDDNVTDAFTFNNIGYVSFADSPNPERPYFFIAGFDQATFNVLPMTLFSGRLPENSSEVLITGKVQTDSDSAYQIGDTLSLAVGSRLSGNKILGQHDAYTDSETLVIEESEKTYTIVGVCRTPVFENNSSPGYTLITRADPSAAADSLSLFITLEKPYQIHSYLKAAAGSHAYILNDDVLRFLGISGSSGDVLVAFMYSFGGIVIAIIMTGSVFLIYNAFSISLNERTQQIGILSSVGATAKQLRNSVLFEGICVGILGIPIGVLAGLICTDILLSAVSSKFTSILYANVPLTLHVSALAIIGAVAVSVITILISAYIPARKASNTPVMECIRQTNEVKLEAKSVKTSWQAHYLIGMEGILALKNFKRNKKRYRSIILSLILSIVLFISTSSLITDLKQVADPKLEIADCDISFSTQTMNESEVLLLYEKMKNVTGIYESSYQIYTDYSVTVQADRLSDDYWSVTGESASDKMVDLRLGVRFFDDETYLKILENLNLPVEEYTGKGAKQIAVAQMQDNPNYKEGGRLNDMFKDTSLELTIVPQTSDGIRTDRARNISVTFAEFVPPDTPPTMNIPENQTYIFWVIFPWSLKDEYIPADISADMTVLKGLTFQSENPAQSTHEMKAFLDNEEISSAYMLLNTSKMLEDNRNMLFIANLFAYSFIAIISLIAVANVFNTISTNIKLRRRELAMLRSVGMSDRDFNRMMRFECVFYGMKALLFGLPVAIVCSWFIHKGFVVDEFDYILPWSSIGISVFSVLLIIFITMMYAVSQIKKENIIDALRDDMT